MKPTSSSKSRPVDAQCPQEPPLLMEYHDQVPILTVVPCLSPIQQDVVGA